MCVSYYKPLQSVFDSYEQTNKKYNTSITVYQN